MVALCLITLSVPAVGVAQEGASGLDAPTVQTEETEQPEADTEEADEAYWREEWTRFQWWQYAMTLTLFAATMVIETDTVVRLRDDDDWSGGILWDEAVQDAIAAPTQTTRKLAARISDVFFHFNMSVPAIIDPVVGGLLIHGDPDLAWQIFWIGAQARVITGFLTRMAQVIVGRDRPYVRHCESGAYLDDACERKPLGYYQSFFSGHTSLVFASAGATCSIHENIPLYGGGTIDDLACGVTIGSGILTGLFRLISDRHWSTDVLIGAGVGFTVGYFLPEWLQFTEGEAGATVIPTAMGEDGAGLVIDGRM